MSLNFNALKLCYIMLLLSIGLYSFRDFNHILPLNASHIITIILFFISLYVFFNKSRVDKFFINFFAFFTFYFLILLYTYGLDIKAFVNFFIFSFTAYVVVFNQSTKRLFEWYFVFVKILIFFAILQFVSYYFMPEWFYSFSFLGLGKVNVTTSSIFIRLFSISTEPASFFNLILPAVGISIARFLNIKNVECFLSKKFAFIILLVACFTFSSVAYISMSMIFLYFIFFSNNIKKTYKVFLVLFLMVFIVSFLSLNVVKERFESSLTVLNSNTVEKVDNLSTFALYSNALVSLKVIQESPFFGDGLFSHSHSYDKYIYDIYPASWVRMELNKKDAASIYIRMISEVGIIGTLILFCFYIYIIISNYRNDFTLSNILFISFLLVGLRNGTLNYTLIWFYFFWALYLRKLKQ